MSGPGPQPWASGVRISGTVAHGIAILATTSRLVYRRWIKRFWWEDIWAALALICDVGCFVTLWTQQAPANETQLPRIDIASHWLSTLTITSVVWFARMSILSSVIRIANPSTRLRRIAYGIGALFLAIWIALVAQKLVICIQDLCQFGDSAAVHSVALSQLITDIISDTILVITPVVYLRSVKLSRDRRILILSAFSASMLITGVTILHSILLLEASTTVTLILVHAALVLLVCNALVFVTLAYRLIRKSSSDLEHSVVASVVQFTSVIALPSQASSYRCSTREIGCPGCQVDAQGLGHQGYYQLEQSHPTKAAGEFCTVCSSGPVT